MSNILEACAIIANNPFIELKAHYNKNNRANSMGTTLELFIKYAFADALHDTDELSRMEKISKVYSYEGNQNNPPDLILKNSDAIEVKKIQSQNATLALNSSYPKAKLLSNSKMITEACRNCESKKWVEKDIIYVVGHIPKNTNTITTLWMIYGDCYAASESTYKRIKDKISQSIQNSSDVTSSETSEIAKVKRVDPLGITDLRVRGMWAIENPKKTFGYLVQPNMNAHFQLFALMKNSKFNTFPHASRDKILRSEKLKCDAVKIKNPNNPANLMDATLITFFSE